MAAQGGDLKAVDHELLPQAQFKLPVPAPSSGYVAPAGGGQDRPGSMALGAGRQRKDVIDLAVELWCKVKWGQGTPGRFAGRGTYQRLCPGPGSRKRSLIGLHYCSGAGVGAAPYLPGNQVTW